MSNCHGSTQAPDHTNGRADKQTKTESFPGSPDLREIVSSTGERWLTFRKSLTPDYFIVWRDIAVCYLAILGAVGLSCLASVTLSPFTLLAAAPLFALWLGYWLASLNNFMHEAAHHNLAKRHSTNDYLANTFVTSLFGIDIKDYRAVHWQHHLHLGHEGDTEVSYRNRPTVGMLLQTVTGIYLLRVLLRYHRAGNASKGKTSAKPANSRLALVRTASIHLAILTTFAVLGWYVAAAVWIVTIVGTFPTFATLRQTLEHRPPVSGGGAHSDRYSAVNRIFGEGPIASTLGSAGFNRHLLHHWDPAISYTRFPEMESFLLRSNVAGQIKKARSTYFRTLHQLLFAKGDSTLISSVHSCPVCKSHNSKFFANAQDVEYRTSDDVYRYLQCTECESVFLEDPPVDKLNVIYPTNYYSFQQTASKVSVLERIKQRFDARLFKQVLKQIPGDRLRVLDVGGGTGWLLSQVRGVSDRVAETHEVDIDETAREAAEAAGHVFHAKRVEEFESSEKFDLILLLNLIEHVADPAAVLESMTRLLSPDGVLLIKTPNTKTLDRHLFQHRNWGGFHCPRHFVLFTLDSFREMAKRCGLDVVRAKYTQGAPQWTASIMAQLMRWKLVNVSAERPMYKHPLNTLLTGLTAAFDYLRLPFSRTTQMFLTLKRAATESSEAELTQPIKKSA